MLGVLAYIYEHRPYSATLYPTSFALGSFLALSICAQRKTNDWCFHPGPHGLCEIFRVTICFGTGGEEGYLGNRWVHTDGHSKYFNSIEQNRMDSRSFRSRCWAFQRRYTSTDPIQLLCIRLALPLTPSLPSGFAPSARLMVCVSRRALWLAGNFSCDYTSMFWDERGGGLTGQPVGPQVDTATIRTVLSKTAWTREVLAQDVGRYGVHIRARTLFGYFVSD